MGSYSQTIMPAAKSPGFEALNSSIDMYSKAMMKRAETDYETKAKQAKYDKSKQDAIAKGLKIEESMSSSGPSWKEVKEKPYTPTLADLQVGAAGALPAEKLAAIGKNMSIAPAQLPPEQTPGAAMSMIDGSMGDMNEQPVAPVQEDYGKTVMNALRVNPMVNRPGRQATQLPTDFASDFRLAHDSAAGNPEAFVTSLKDLGLKYADNPVALTQIKRLIDMNKTDKPKRSGRPTRK